MLWAAGLAAVYYKTKQNARKRSLAHHNSDKGGGDGRPPTGPTSPPLVDLGPVIKAPLDSKRYKVVQLQNGLRATLVSTCVHETKMPGGDGKSNAEDMSVHHSSLSSKSNADPKSPPPPSSMSLQEKIDNFNRTYLGIQTYHQFGESMNQDQNQNLGAVTSGDGKASSNCVGTHSSPKPTKIPKLLKCCDGLATICVTVNAGSFHDPKEIPGLAHFVEHLIFLGSKQHPEANKLFTKVFENSGLVNATTYPECTNFYFSCNFSAFEECVEILVDGLTNPLFREADIRREREAVDSEYGIKQTCDYTRIADFLRSRAKAGHPFHNFYWGDKDTLNHKDIRTRATKFRQQFYNATNMTVCIQASIPMEQLEDLLVNNFSDIPSAEPNAESPSKLLLAHGDPFDMDTFHASYLVSPLSRLTCLAISWALPAEFWKDYETKPLEYIRIMLQDTSSVGLKHYLREKQWITEWSNLDVNCCTSDNYCRSVYCSLFTISIYLTDKGHKEKQDVTLALFSYLKMLSTRGVTPQIFEEMKRTAATKFHFHNWTEMLQSGVNLAVNMQHVPPQHILTSTTLLTKWDSQAILKCLKLLTPQSANFISVACEHAQACKSTEGPGKIRFSKEAFLPTQVEEMKNVAIYPEFKLPPLGTFLGKEIRLNAAQGDGQKCLKTIVKSDKLVVEHVNTRMSPCLAPQVPSGLYTIFLSSHLVSSRPSKAQQGLMELWIRLLQDNIIQKAGHKYDHLFGLELQSTDDGILIDLTGPRCHLVELMTLVAREIFGLGGDVTGVQNPKNVDFAENLKVDLVREYCNDTYNVELLSRDIANYLLKKNHASLFEIKDEIEDITVRDREFAHLINQFRRRMQVSVELQGSVRNEDAQQIVNLFMGKSQEKIQYLSPGILPDIKDRGSILPLGISQLNIKALHPAYVTSVVTNVYQVDMWQRGNKKQRENDNTRYFLSLLYHLMRRRIANQLRTKEQLGYTVRLSPQCEGGCEAHGLSVTVFTHPHKFTVDHVDSRIEAFFRSFYQTLKHEEMKKHLLKFKDMNKEKVEELEAFFKDNLIRGGANYRKLSIRLEGYMPGTKISAKKQQELAKAGDKEKDAKDDGSWSMIQLDYLTVKDERARQQLAKNGVQIIEDVGLFKKELGLLPNSY